MLAITAHKNMGLYKLSSQFTDFVASRSSNPDRILTQVGEAIEHLGELNVPLPGDAPVVSAFHESDSLTDDFMMSYLQGDPTEKARVLNSMYEILGNLERTGKIDKITAKAIEKFLEAYSPVEVPKPEVQEDPNQIRPGVIRGRRGPKQEVPEIEEHENWNRFTAPEERMISRLDRTAGSNVQLWKLLAFAGVLERIPDFNQRQARLAGRKFEWVKVALPENKQQKLEEIKNTVRTLAKKMRTLELLRDKGEMSEKDHLANFEYLAQQANRLHGQMDELEKENIPVYDLSIASDIKYIRNSIPPKMG